jgi:nitrate/nitrite transporter NarK
MNSVVSTINGKIGASWFSPKEIGIFMGAFAATGNLGTFAVQLTSGFVPSLQTGFVVGVVVVAVLGVIWVIFGRDAKNITAPAAAENHADAAPEAPKLSAGKILAMPRI